MNMHIDRTDVLQAVVKYGFAGLVTAVIYGIGQVFAWISGNTYLLVVMLVVAVFLLEVNVLDAVEKAEATKE
jgi:membrane protein YqaA with SNARE-associated domain